MTDENLDKLMRKVLIDALRMEWSDALNESPTMSTTKEFQHQMKVMLRDPFAWYHKKTRPCGKSTSNGCYRCPCNLSVLWHADGHQSQCSG